MQTEPQITFHHLDSSQALETLIRGEIQELEQFFDGIVGCRVAIEAPTPNRRGQAGVRERFTARAMAENTVAVLSRYVRPTAAPAPPAAASVP